MTQIPYLTVPQAAAQLGISRQRLSKLVAEGRIPSVQMGAGGLRLIDPKDLEAVRVRRVGRPPKAPNTVTSNGPSKRRRQPARSDGARTGALK